MVDSDSPTWKYGRYRIDCRFQQKIGRNRPSMWIHTKQNRSISTVNVPSYQKQSVDGRYRRSKWTWTQKNHEDWPYSPILGNKKMYMIDSHAHLCSPGPISSTAHKTTHNQETNTHKQSVWFTQSRASTRPFGCHSSLALPRVTLQTRSLLWRFKREASCDASNASPLGPAAFFREVRTMDLWSHMVP